MFTFSMFKNRFSQAAGLMFAFLLPLLMLLFSIQLFEEKHVIFSAWNSKSEF